ncbi:monovalent cation:proton antiporter-2 (CPA2) family protein [Maricaulis sp.]|uniref:monovalent cation:proton antiporter-2 (CPA2) family protein n=1 Tax=Maricaulis sp. TaxID=1486257 RepID=UPI002630C644|nr:monovalent cation:proton antiporter-2 (CPA2) family protein [Maricaulis sp.]
MGDFLLLAFIFLSAGVIAVPIASRLGLGSVLGYLLAGIAISPLLSAIDVDVTAIQQFAEFGVVMMLFLVGIELDPRRLWDLRAKLLGLGGLQVALTVVALMGIAMLFGFSWSVALAIGLILMLSSTAIVLQTLQEKGLLKSDGGQGSFSVLLFQDIAVIPMLALIPLLALPELMPSAADSVQAASGDDGGSLSLVDGLAGWQQAGVTIAAIAFVILGGSYLTRPIFRFIAMAQLRELFTATALMIVIGIALLMTLVGLSPALGTFLAGVVLANSEYRHELESDIDPFKGLLLGLFFITVGASINFALLFADFLPFFGAAVGFMAVKAVVMLGLAIAFKIRGADKWLFALGLAHAGEFAFVLLSLSVANYVIPQVLADQLLLVVALSMLITPLLFILFDKVIAPAYAKQGEEKADEIDENKRIIIAGHGRFGGIVNRMLRREGYETTVLDYSSEQLEMLRTFGFQVYFGDATRPDLLHAAGIADANMLIIAIDDKEQITALTRYVRQHSPDVHIIARAKARQHVYDLYAAGCRDIIRETFDSGVRTGRSAFEALGVHPFEAERMARGFVRSDREAIVEMAALYDPDIPIHQNPAYVAKSRELTERQNTELRQGQRAFSGRNERGWVPPTLDDVDAEEGSDGKKAGD